MRTNRFFRARRLVWRARRSPPRLARPISRILPRFEAPERPVLVIGCPRSGTSVLLQALLQSPTLRSVQSEGHILWDEFRHPRDHDWDSDARDAAGLSEREREYVYSAIRLFARSPRFVDKTPENCLRIGYLDALFPDARFVFLHRDGAENVSSLMEGWRARPRFAKYQLPVVLDGLGALNGATWSFVLVPGWRDLRHASLEQICARQYVASNEAALDAKATIDPDRWVDVRYEDLTDAPERTLRRVFDAIGEPFTGEVERFAAELGSRRSATTLTAPRSGKWRDENPDAVTRVLPLLTEIEHRLGRTSS